MLEKCTDLDLNNACVEALYLLYLVDRKSTFEMAYFLGSSLIFGVPRTKIMLPCPQLKLNMSLLQLVAYNYSRSISSPRTLKF